MSTPVRDAYDTMAEDHATHPPSWPSLSPARSVLHR
jgi:hypothetical protein